MEILRIYVNVTECHEVVSGERTVRMLPFEGTCDGPFFRGTILSGGVDTQKGYADGTGTLSARYMIAGTDCEGNSCKLFIENNAEFNSYTVPSIITDSPALKWMEDATLRGRLEFPDGKLNIVIEMPGAEEDSMGMLDSHGKV